MNAMRGRWRAVRGLAAALAVLAGAGTVPGAAAAADIAVPRGQLLRQTEAWFAGPEGRRLADNIVAQQAPVGGWTNWTNEGGMLKTATPEEIRKQDHGSIDDGATTTQLKLLARVVSAPGNAAEPRLAAWRAAARRGIDFLLAAQYPNGGWPQHYPGKGYRTNITFNDNATYDVVTVLRAAGAPDDPLHRWVEPARKEKARAAVAKAIDCILKCQVVVNGTKTAWGAQHDPQTLQPAAARAFEPVSLTGSETVGLVRLLMTVEPRTPEIVAAVEAAVAWLRAVRIDGIRVERFQTPEGRDARVVEDPQAPPLWARFYEIGTNRPIFAGRDAVVKYGMAQIERERRGGYGWYGDRPRDLLEKEYPRWQAAAR